jgi:hypothetical protein
MLPRSFALESGSLQSLPSSPRCPTNGCFGSLLSGLESAADPEHVPIRMAKGHLADVPRISVGGNVTSSPAATHSLCISSRRPPRPASRPPCRPLRLRLAETWWCSRRGRGLLAPPRKERCKFPCPIQPRQNVGGVPQSHNFFHPHFSNQANVLARSDTFNIGVRPLASITEGG